MDRRLPTARSPAQRPLARHPVRPDRPIPSRRARANALKPPRHVMGVRAVAAPRCSDPRAVATARKNSSSDRRRSRRSRPGQVASKGTADARDVERARCQRLVHRQAVAPDPDGLELSSSARPSAIPTPRPCGGRRSPGRRWPRHAGPGGRGGRAARACGRGSRPRSRSPPRRRRGRARAGSPSPGSCAPL